MQVENIRIEVGSVVIEITTDLFQKLI